MQNSKEQLLICEKNTSDLDIKISRNNSIFVDKNALLNVEKNIVVNKDEELKINFCDISLNDLNIVLNVTLKERASFTMKGCILLKNHNKNIKVNIVHQERDSYSFCELYGVNNSNSNKDNLIFDLISTVNTGATNSNTRVVGKILNLNENVNSKILPILKINENEVKASHGAALGSCNKEELYYLQSRGLTKEESEALIIKGYFDNVIKTFNSDILKAKIDNALQ